MPAADRGHAQWAAAIAAVGIHRTIADLRRDGSPVPREAAQLRELLAAWSQVGAEEIEQLAAPSRLAPLLLTHAQAGDVLGVSDRHVRRLIADGRLPGVHVDRRAFVRVADVEAFVARLPTDEPTRGLAERKAS